MNAELRRNFWLELSPSRMLLMAGVLALIFAIAWLGGRALDDRWAAISGAGEVLFGVIVAFWGSFKAGRSVSDEIRERTWDFQRLSALTPASMTIGKLFGATAYVWFGGAIALAAIGAGQGVAHGWQAALFEIVKLILLGVFAHAVALATSLAVVRRGRGKERVDAFLFTIAGVVAFQTANAASGGKDRMFYEQSTSESGAPVGVDWMGVHLTHEGWAFLVLGVLTLWAVCTCWRLMRAELQAPTNPLWFPLFLLAPVLLAVGRFTDPREGVTAAYFMIHALVLLTVLLEPKDFVGWRALTSELRMKARGAGRYWPATLTGVVVAFLAACTVAAMTLSPATNGAQTFEPLIGFAAFAFLLREVAIFVFFHLGARQRRGDFAALVTIALLCVAGPAILNILNLKTLSSAFFVQPDGGAAAHLLSIAAGLVEAATFGVLAQARWRDRERGLEAA